MAIMTFSTYTCPFHLPLVTPQLAMQDYYSSLLPAAKLYCAHACQCRAIIHASLAFAEVYMPPHEQALVT